MDIMDAFDTSEVEAAAAAAAAEEERRRTNATSAGRLRTPLQRADDHRQRGNDLYNQGLWEEALDLYGRAVNALPDDVKALSNRSASWARLRRFQDALLDADMALECVAPLLSSPPSLVVVG